MSRAERPGALWLLLLVMAAPPAAAQNLTVSGEPVCAGCRIVQTGSVALGSIDDDESSAGLPRVVAGVDSVLYAVSDLLPTAGAMMYAADGRHIGRMGRPGSGPGEVRHVMRLAVAPDGKLILHDLANGPQVYAPSREFVRSLRQMPVSTTNLVVMADSLLAVVAPTRPASAPSHPIQLYSLHTGEFVRGTGPESDLQPGSPRPVTRVAPSADGTVWAIEPPHRLSRWDVNGRRLGQIEWNPDWLLRVNPVFRGVASEYAHVLDDAWEDASRQLLWVSSVVDDPRHRGSTPPVRPGEPFPRDYFTPARLNRVKTSIISVVDLRRGEVIAHLEIDALVYQFLNDGRIVLMYEDSTGYQWIEIVTLTLERPM